MFGKGLVKGLEITLREFFTPKVTIQYPEEKTPMPERFHGRLSIEVDKCIACSMCANACPNEVIKLKRQKVGKKQYLTDYVQHVEYCLFCGLCVEACPVDALHFTSIFNMNQYYYAHIPVVLVKREAPAAPAEEAEPPAKPKPQPKADAPGAASEVAAGKSSDKEGE